MLRPGRSGDVHEHCVGVLNARVDVECLAPAHVWVEPVLGRNPGVRRDLVDDRLGAAVVVGHGEGQIVAAPGK